MLDDGGLVHPLPMFRRRLDDDVGHRREGAVAIDVGDTLKVDGAL
jgi:hypothetical protein